MEIVKQNNFNELINSVYQTHCLLLQNAQKAININLTIRNWLIGCYIVEFEQNGEDRAKYGTRLLEAMAKMLKTKGVKGLDKQSLGTCRTFYSVYPQFLEVAFQKIQNHNPNLIRGLVSRELLNIDNKHDTIRGALTRELQTINNQNDPIWRSVSAKLEEDYPIPSDVLLSRLSFTHFVEIIRKEDPLERLFYEVETIKNNWSVRELERAIDTALYVRTGLSKDKGAVIRKFKNQKPAQNMEIIREPYILEFLGLEERSAYNETELEQEFIRRELEK